MLQNVPAEFALPDHLQEVNEDHPEEPKTIDRGTQTSKRRGKFSIAIQCNLSGILPTPPLPSPEVSDISSTNMGASDTETDGHCYSDSPESSENSGEITAYIRRYAIETIVNLVHFICYR